MDGRAAFPLTFTTNACTREYEAPRTQGIVLDFVFLRGCLGNEEGLPLEVCETLGNKKHHDSHLFHSITLLNLTPFQPGMLSVCCVSGGAAQISTDSSACPLPPHSDLENNKNLHFSLEKGVYPDTLTSSVPVLPSTTFLGNSSPVGNGTDSSRMDDWI